jgi:GTPase SAR1 family protein
MKIGIIVTGITTILQFIAGFFMNSNISQSEIILCRKLKAIFITGTAGSGKSILTSKILQYYEKNGAFASVLNLDPGVESLPYTPDVDVRDYVDIVTLMKQYDLGPNGSMIMASDLIASKLDQIENQVGRVNPDYLIVDTPGQMELFAYRTSGPFFIQNINAEEKMNVFLYDGTMITSPNNFISVSLLATSIKLRLGLPTINVMTKTDLIPDKIDQILKWSSDPISLEESIRKDSDGETYSLSIDIIRSLNLGELIEKLIPISNATEEGMINLESALSRIINLGEEVED